MRRSGGRTAVLVLLALGALAVAGCGSDAKSTTTATVAVRLSTAQYAGMEAKAVAVGQALQGVTTSLSKCDGSRTKIRDCAAKLLASGGARLKAFVGTMQPYVDAVSGTCKADLQAFDASVTTMADQFIDAGGSFAKNDRAAALKTLKAVDTQSVTRLGGKAEASCKPVGA
jgi:hypothetical protein